MSQTEPAASRRNGGQHWAALALLIFLVAAVAAAFLTYRTVRDTEREVEMLRLATSVLTEYPSASAEDHALRQWAVAVVDAYSSVPLPEAARYSLLNPPAQVPQAQVPQAQDSPAQDPAAQDPTAGRDSVGAGTGASERADFNASEECLDGNVLFLTQNTEILVAEENGNCALRIPSGSGHYRGLHVCDFGDDTDVYVTFPGDSYELSYTHEPGAACVIEARATRF